jgi:TRAP transporter TAXI family solute receptor
MADGHLDAILYGAMVYPAPTFVDLSSRKDLRLLSLSDEVIKKLVITYKGLEPYTLPPNSYRGVTYPVKGVASLVNIIVREDMPSEVAYLITKTVAENFERYRGNVKAMQLGSVKEMPKDVGIPFHPGALRYYKEKGWIK